MAGCSRWLKAGERAFVCDGFVLCPECKATHTPVRSTQYLVFSWSGELFVAAQCGELAWKVEHRMWDARRPA